jgi:hypothetical protein
MHLGWAKYNSCLLPRYITSQSSVVFGKFLGTIRFYEVKNDSIHSTARRIAEDFIVWRNIWATLILKNYKRLQKRKRK